MKSLFASLSCWLWCAVGLAQFPIGQTSITFTDPARANRAVATEIYYPATSVGLNKPLAAGQFPVLSFGHGFQMVWSAYQNIWEALVPEGYIVCFPKTEGGLVPNHTEFAKDLAFVVAQMKVLHTTSGSLFQNHVKLKFAVLGHSMGGGCAVLARQYNTDITAIAALAPAETNPSAIAAAATVARPGLIFTGTYDCITPAATHGLPMYTALNGTCKQYVSITGGSHCQFNNFNANCALGEGVSGCASPPITRAQQQAIVKNLLVPWLDFHLDGLCGRWADFQNIFTAAAGFSTQQSCPVSAVCPTPSMPTTSNITATSAQLNWAGSLCAGVYNIQWKLASASTWTNLSVNAPTITRVLTGLTPGTTYKWRVRSRCSPTAVGISAWSPQKTFSTLPNLESLENQTLPAHLLETGRELEDRNSAYFPDLEAIEEDLSPAVYVFPNPAKEQLQVRLDNFDSHSALRCRVIDMLGRSCLFYEIPNSPAEESFSLSLDALPAGCYWLQISGAEGVFSEFFEKKSGN